MLRKTNDWKLTLDFYLTSNANIGITTLDISEWIKITGSDLIQGTVTYDDKVR